MKGMLDKNEGETVISLLNLLYLGKSEFIFQKTKDKKQKTKNKKQKTIKKKKDNRDTLSDFEESSSISHHRTFRPTTFVLILLKDNEVVRKGREHTNDFEE